jgi:ubiquinone biosynthesis protein COQ9
MDNTKIKTEILEQALNDVPFDGWSIDTFKGAAQTLGHDPMLITALFPNGLHDTFKLFASWADSKMLVALQADNTKTLRIHEKISLAVDTRIGILETYKDCVRETAKMMATPQYARTGVQITWDCADTIWNWAGDTATDYNRYTKRTLLGCVFASKMLYWLQDDSDGHEKTTDFLNRRIQNVLAFGKNAGPFIKPVASVFERFIVRKNS